MGIRDFAPDLIIAVTTSGRAYKEFSKRADVLVLSGMAKPDMASLTLSLLNFNQTSSKNDSQTIQDLATKMNKKGIKPELEIFDHGMIKLCRVFNKKRIITSSTLCKYHFMKHCRCTINPFAVRSFNSKFT